MQAATVIALNPDLAGNLVAFTMPTANPPVAGAPTSTIGADAFQITQASTCKTECLELLDYFTRDDTWVKIALKEGYTPMRADLANNPGIVADPYLHVMALQVGKGVIPVEVVAFSPFAEMRKKLCDWFVLYFTGKVSAEQAVDGWIADDLLIYNEYIGG